MAIINGNRIATSTYVIDEGSYYTKEQSAEVFSNPNLLINGDFRINQREQSSYSGNGIFTVDNWKLHSLGSLNVNDDGTITYTISTTNWCGIQQTISKPSYLTNKTFTISLKGSATSGVWISIYQNGTSLAGTYTRDSGDVSLQFTVTFGDVLETDEVLIRVTTRNTDMPDGVTNNSFTLEYVKMEIGSIATAFSPKSYEEELADCQVINGGLSTTYSNPNLLINGDFRVNQRGFTTGIIASKYTVDRWKAGSNQNTNEITVNDGSITITNVNPSSSVSAYLIQELEEIETSKLENKMVTISCCDIDGNIYSKSAVASSTVGSSPSLITDWGWFRLYRTNTNYEMTIQVATGKSVTLKWVKLELGSVATAFTPRPYAEELALCQRYYQVITNRQNNIAVARSSIDLRISGTYLQTMRTIPTVNQINTIEINGSTDAIQTSVGFQVVQQGKQGYLFGLKNWDTNLTTNGVYFIKGDTEQNIIELDAEIY